MMEKSSKIKLSLLIATVVIVAIILEREYLTAKSPSSVKAMVYKVELMTDAKDTNPEAVFSDPAGREIDLTNDIIIGQASRPVGTYKRMRMTAANGVKLSIGNPDDDPCGGGSIFTDRVFTAAGPGTDPNSQVQIIFATYDDNGGTWSGPRITHILLAPVKISGNRNARMKFRFTTGNSLFCSRGAVAIRAPWAVWTETL